MLFANDWFLIPFADDLRNGHKGYLVGLQGLPYQFFFLFCFRGAAAAAITTLSPFLSIYLIAF